MNIHKKTIKMYYVLRDENATGSVKLWLKNHKKPTENQAMQMLVQMIDRELEEGDLTELNYIMEDYLDWAEGVPMQITQQMVEEMENDPEDEQGLRYNLAWEIMNNSVQGSHLLWAIRDKDCQPEPVLDEETEQPEQDDQERLERTISMFIMEDL